MEVDNIDWAVAGRGALKAAEGCWQLAQVEVELQEVEEGLKLGEAASISSPAKNCKNQEVAVSWEEGGWGEHLEGWSLMVAANRNRMGRLRANSPLLQGHGLIILQKPQR